MSKEEILATLEKLSRQLSKQSLDNDENQTPRVSRKEIESARKKNSAVFALAIYDEDGEKIRKFRNLTFEEASKRRQDWYKVLVLSLKKRVKLSVEYQDRTA